MTIKLFCSCRRCSYIVIIIWHDLCSPFIFVWQFPASSSFPFFYIQTFILEAFINKNFFHFSFVQSQKNWIHNSTLFVDLDPKTSIQWIEFFFWLLIFSQFTLLFAIIIINSPKMSIILNLTFHFVGMDV